MLVFLITYLSSLPIRIECEEPNLVPLKRMELDIQVYEGSSQTLFTLEYHNSLTSTLKEAKLILPFDTSFAISDVILKYQGKVFMSSAFDKTTSKTIYEEHKSQNETSLLVSREGDMLSIMLATIPSGIDLEIKFTMFGQHSIRFDSIKEEFFTEYGFPVTFIPRYSPIGSSIPEQPELQNQKTIPYDFGIRFKAPGASHLDTKNVDDSFITDNSFSIFKPIEKDFIVRVYHKSVPSNFVEETKDTQCVTFNVNGLNLLKESKQKSNPSIVFLVDRSGSMEGDPITNVRKALEVFLHSVPDGSTFDIVGFGSSYQSLFKSQRTYNDNTLSHAKSYIEGIRANLGGTEILEPLKYILTEQKPDVLFLLTDGAVSNNEEILSFVQNYPTRIFTLGIGLYSSIDLVRGLASKTGGIYEFVRNMDDIDSAVVRLLTDAINPALSMVTIDTDCGESMQRIPCIIPRNSLTTLSFIGPKKQCSVKVSGKTEDQTILDIIFDSSTAQQLGSSKHHHCTSIVRAANEDVITQEKAVQYAKAFNLLTKHTSLVLFDETKKHQGGDISIKIPIPYRDVPEMVFAAPNMALGHAYSKSSRKLHRSISADNMADQMNAPVQPAEPQTASVSTTNHEDICLKLSKLQKSNGIWKDIKEIETLLSIAFSIKDENELTAYAIEFLKKNCSSKYSLITEKAVKTLIKSLDKTQYEELSKWALGRV